MPSNNEQDDQDILPADKGIWTSGSAVTSKSLLFKVVSVYYILNEKRNYTQL